MSTPTPVWTQANSTLHIQTRREGMLSPVGHDLRLRVGRFEVLWEPGSGAFSASFELSTVEVVAALDGEREVHDALSSRDKRKITDKTRDDVLQVGRYPYGRADGTATLPPSDGAGSLEGTLELRGARRPVRGTVRPVAGQLEARVTIRTPDFGIKPVSALLGTLKVRPDVEIILRGPVPVR